MSDSAPADFPFDLDLSAQPHDGFFKAVFSDPDKAGAFFRRHLPEEVAARIQWSSLAVLPASFVKRDLQQSHSDLLFSVRLEERETLLYLVFEHQSTPDPLMPLRLLGYMVEILLSHTRDHAPPLPPVMGFVLHQGPATWNVSTSFEDLFDLPPETAEALLPYLPKFRHALLDLTQSDPSGGEDRADVRMILQLMKCAREQRLLEFFDWLAGEYSRLRTSLSEALLRLALWYALHSDASLDVEEIYRHLHREPQLQHTTMSVAEKLIAKGQALGEARGEARGVALGEARGVALGEAQGRASGKWIGKLQMLEELLGEPVTPEEDLRALTLEDLERRYRECQARYDMQFKRHS